MYDTYLLTYLLTWHGIDQIIIHSAIDEWRGRLRASDRRRRHQAAAASHLV